VYSTVLILRLSLNFGQFDKLIASKLRSLAGKPHLSDNLEQPHLAQKNKAKTNPISEKPKMNVNLFTTKDYENETTLRLQKNKPNLPAPKGVKQKSDAGCLSSVLCSRMK